jgi:hypothetical protein
MGGGTSPQWDGRSTELLYVSGNNQLMATPFTEGPTGVTVGLPQALFPIPNVAETDWLLYPPRTPSSLRRMASVSGWL